MAHLRSLRNAKCEVGSAHLGDWPLAVGQFMLNFASLELLSYQYLNSLESTRAEFDAILGAKLSVRIKRIRELIAASPTLSEDQKTEADALWTTVPELSVWRNRIAHNPVLPIWKTSNPKTEPPDLIGVPDMKQLKGSNKTDSLSREHLAELIDATAEIASRLSVRLGTLSECGLTTACSRPAATAPEALR